MTPFSAEKFNQARTVLTELQQQKIALVSQLNQQGRKLTELERELERHSSAAAQAQLALVDARREIETLRSQIPDTATREAYEALVMQVSCPADKPEQLRAAA